MKILIDTHIAVWAVASSDKLPQDFIEKLKDLNNTIYVSIVSAWEVAIKNIKNKRLMPVNEKEFVDTCKNMEFEFLPIKLAHLMNLRNLKLKNENVSHKDPFDRMLIAQSNYENIDFYTRDNILQNYTYENIHII